MLIQKEKKKVFVIEKKALLTGITPLPLPHRMGVTWEF